MNALLPVALALAPELARWLVGDHADQTTSAVVDAVQAVAGTADPDAAAAVLQRDPAMATALHLKLAQLAADRDGAARAADLDAINAKFRAMTGPQTTDPAPSSAKSPVAWSAPIVSALVLITFAAVMLLVLVSGVPPGTDTVANMLLGTLAAMATSVVSYWVGSSAGSARKEERLAQVNRPGP